MTQCGSPLWMAPEMIKNEPYDEKADVYSFGICLWELYTRKIPYRDLGLSPSHLVVKVVREALRPPLHRAMPEPYVNLVEKCWHPKPKHRPTFDQILATLEEFLQEPIIMSHKPGSKSKQVPDASKANAKSQDELIAVKASGAGVNDPRSSFSHLEGWKIDDPTDVQVDFP